LTFLPRSASIRWSPYIARRYSFGAQVGVDAVDIGGVEFGRFFSLQREQTPSGLRHSSWPMCTIAGFITSM
jgi:hypothetical protein